MSCQVALYPVNPKLRLRLYPGHSQKVILKRDPHFKTLDAKNVTLDENCTRFCCPSTVLLKFPEVQYFSPVLPVVGRCFLAPLY